MNCRLVSRITIPRGTNVSRELSSQLAFLVPALLLDYLSHIYRLPNVPRPRMSICILADAADIDRAKQIDLEYMSVDDLKKCVSLYHL